MLKITKKGSCTVHMWGGARQEEFGWGLVFGNGEGRGGLHCKHKGAQEWEWHARGGRACVNERRRGWRSLARKVLGFSRSFTLTYGLFEGEIPLDFVPE
jgi:hypothetical protein